SAPSWGGMPGTIVATCQLPACGRDATSLRHPHPRACRAMGPLRRGVSPHGPASAIVVGHGRAGQNRDRLPGRRQPYGVHSWRALPPPPAREWLNGRARLRHLLEQHVDFPKLAGLVGSQPCAPRLLIAAVDVMSGEFRVFKSDAERWEITPDALLASAALPML